MIASGVGNVYYLKDHLNTVNEITNASGVVIQKFEYSAFGKLAKVRDANNVEVSFGSAPVRTSFTYTGREYEPELNMYYYRARYYDPSTGRFLQKDPSPGFVHLPNSLLSKYVYTVNNPIAFRDSSGRDIWDEIGKVITVVVAVVAAFYAGAAVAAYLGVSGVAGALVGAFTGALVGGSIGAVGYSFSHSNPSDGFRIGAISGFFAGGAGGYLSNSAINVGHFSGITPEQVYGFSKDQLASAASGVQGGSKTLSAIAEYANVQSWPIWATLAGYANAALPYATALGAAGATAYFDNCIQSGTCSDLIPKNGSKTWNWEF